MSGTRKKAIHEQPDLCHHILSRASDSSVPLRIGPSSIPNAGSGLFAVNDVPAGTLIFTSQPLLVVSEASNKRVCDFCLLDQNGPLHPDGRFFAPGELRSTVKISACTRCEVAQYCSKECQTKAWESYHKFECSLLKENKQSKNDTRIGSLPQALCRLLLWIKKQTLCEEDFKVLANLETHFDERMEHWRNTNNDESGKMEPTLGSAYCAKQATRSGLDLSIARQLYCVLCTNGFAIRPPEIETSYGSCLDLLVALINHSCEENAHAFVEGRQVVCRAMKDIPAGTEITVFYPTAPSDVLLRRDDLKQYMFIKCDCKKCKDEMNEHIATGVDRKEHLATLTKAQLDLVELCEKMDQSFDNSATRVVSTCIDFQNKIVDITNHAYKNGNWPDHIEPLPTTYRLLGNMYLDLGYAVGLEFVLKGTIYSRYHSGPRWVRQLLKLSKHVFFVANADDEEIKWIAATKNAEFLQRSVMRDVTRGYLSILCIDGKFSFGGETKFVRAIHAWASEIINFPGDPVIESDEFKKRFRDSQERLLVWAGIDTELGLELPSSEKMEGLKHDIAAIQGAAEVAGGGQMTQ